MKAHGTVHKYGDNVDTDVIIPLNILILLIRRNWLFIVWKILIKIFVKTVKPGEIIVAEKNFWLWFIEGTCTDSNKSIRRKLCNSRDICKDILQECN